MIKSLINLSTCLLTLEFNKPAQEIEVVRQSGFPDEDVEHYTNTKKKKNKKRYLRKQETNSNDIDHSSIKPEPVHFFEKEDEELSERVNKHDQTLYLQTCNSVDDLSENEDHDDLDSLPDDEAGKNKMDMFV